MNRKLYWKQQLPLLSLHFLCMVSLTLFLRVTGNSLDGILLILCVWIAVLAAYFAKTYHNRNRQMEKLLKLAEQLEERYLIPEVMEKPDRADDQVYYLLLKMAGKSMLEQVEAVRRERTEYKEYVEQWVHEIKTPITAMKLLCENHHPRLARNEFADNAAHGQLCENHHSRLAQNEFADNAAHGQLCEDLCSRLTKKILAELEKTNRFTEQALYYARSEHPEKDYSVREIRLLDVIHQAIAENKYLLLQNGVRIDLQEIDDTVYSDGKWVGFILNQLIANSVKYRTAQPILKLYTERQCNQITLYVQDNGIGIDASDLPRIFEKGFTGKNGRETAQDATGIGLYLCKRLCGKLGIGICAFSENSGTTIQLSFLINDFIQRLQD